MLLQFSVANFRSIKDKVTLDLRAASITEREAENVVPIGKERVLKGAVLYGANASGKSNVIRALERMQHIVHTISNNPMASEKIGPSSEQFRLEQEFPHDESFFEIVVSSKENSLFRYGFKILSDGIVAEEWFYEKKDAPRAREIRLFQRDRQEISVGPQMKSARPFTKNTRDNTLFLCVCFFLQVKEVMGVFSGFFSCSLIVSRFITDAVHENIILESLFAQRDGRKETPHSQSVKDIAKFLNDFGVNIKSIDIKKRGESESEISSEHSSPHKVLFSRQRDDGSIAWFDLAEEESAGTRKLFLLAYLVQITLTAGTTLVIDEFDSHLHPLASQAIIQLFNSPANDKGAQLIIATHDVNLMTQGHYRRDQIWFTQKNRQQATELYSLVEYKFDEDRKVRKDASYEKDYILGRYGAIPYGAGADSLAALFAHARKSASAPAASASPNP